MNSPIIFDIETIPDRLTEYNQAFPKSKKKAGIHAIISRVVAIGYDLGGCRKVIMGEEEEILKEFADLLNEHRTATLVGFNVKNFDVPLLQLRAAKYGIKLYLPDRRSQRICDLFDILGENGRRMYPRVLSASFIGSYMAQESNRTVPT